MILSSVRAHLREHGESLDGACVLRGVIVSEHHHVDIRLPICGIQQGVQPHALAEARQGNMPEVLGQQLRSLLHNRQTEAERR